MSKRIVEMDVPAAMQVRVSEDELTAVLSDGRTISVPLVWYPRLLAATADERNQLELIADGRHIHWPALDEDLSVEGLLAGRSSSESSETLRRWQAAKQAGQSGEALSLPALRRQPESPSDE